MRYLTYRLRFHLLTWNIWRKRNANSKLHKFLVLIGFYSSPTFEMAKMDAVRRQKNKVRAFGELAAKSAAANPSTAEVAENFRKLSAETRGEKEE